MYAARLITVILIILMILVAYSPQVREAVATTWDTIKPAVVQFMDASYAVVRSLITGDGYHGPNRGAPKPGTPGVNFDRIVTLESGASF